MLRLPSFLKHTYEVGDIAMTLDTEGRSWLVEVTDVQRRGYQAKLTPMTRDRARGLYEVDIQRLSMDNLVQDHTYGFVLANKMIRLRPDNVDFASIGLWQEHLRQKGEQRPVDFKWLVSLSEPKEGMCVNNQKITSGPKGKYYSQ